jgi:hypothetical protein
MFSAAGLRHSVSWLAPIGMGGRFAGIHELAPRVEADSCAGVHRKSVDGTLPHRAHTYSFCGSLARYWSPASSLRAVNEAGAAAPTVGMIDRPTSGRRPPASSAVDRGEPRRMASHSTRTIVGGD